MALIPPSICRQVGGIQQYDAQRIYDFLNGAVYCWCKNRPNEWFALRDLMGGDNFYWNDTPLIKLYEKHIADGKSSEDSITDAAKDAGWMLKKVLDTSKRNFDHKKEDQTRKYLWKR